MENIELSVAIFCAGIVAGAATYATRGIENWARRTIGLNCTILLVFAGKDLWHWTLYESGSVDVFIDSIMDAVAPAMMIGSAGIKVITYIAGFFAGLLFVRREYC